MVCEKCHHKEATVRYTCTVNGKSVAYSLCEDCYRLLVGPESLFSGWLFPGSVPGSMQKSEKKICDLCGYTFARIANEGRVGCARCYRIFEKELAPLIARVHGNKVFVPAKKISDSSISQKEQLQKLMEKAIAEENFEEAAKLRDQIKALKEE